MPLTQFQHVVSHVDQLTALLGTPGPLAIKKQLPALDDAMRRFIAHSPFVIVGTHGRDGRCDASPRGDAPGFVQVLDDHTLVVPDRPGNRRIDSLRNILETGRAALLFFVPGFGETLRINGRAAIVRDPDVLATMPAQGKTPLLGLAVEAEECFLQCAKALLRSKLWEPHVKPDLNTLPCAAEMFVKHAQLPEHDVNSMQQLLDKAYTNLY